MELLELSKDNYFVSQKGITHLTIVVNKEAGTIQFANGNKIKEYIMFVEDDAIKLYDGTEFVADIKKYTDRSLIMREYVGKEITYQALIL